MNFQFINSAKIAVFTVFLTAIFVYGGALNNGFVYDDTVLVEENLSLKEDVPVSYLFLTTVWDVDSEVLVKGTTNYYRPMLILTYKSVYSLFGINSFAFHFANVLFHGLCSVLVYLILSRLFKEPKIVFLASLLFAVHPIHSEVVYFVACMSELGCALFFLLGFYLYVSDKLNFNFRLVLSLLSFLTAMFYKETAVMLPFLIISYEVFLNKEKDKSKIIIASVAYISVMVFYLMLRSRALGGFDPTSGFDTLLGVNDIAMSAVTMTWLYVGKLILPVGLSSFYYFDPVTNFTDYRFLLALLMTVALLVLWYKKLRLNGKFNFALAFFILPLAPTFYLLKTFSDHRWILFQDRFVYLPGIGFIIILVMFLQSDFLSGRIDKVFNLAGKLEKINVNVMEIFLSTIVVVFAVTSIYYDRIWKDNLTLYENAVKKSPPVSLVYNNLGFEYLKLGRYGDAREKFNEALKFNKDFVQAHYNLGLASYEMRQWGDAQDHFEDAVRLGQNSRSQYVFYFYSAMSLKQLGRLDDAIRIMEKSYSLKSSEPLIIKELGLLYGDRGLYGKARDKFLLLTQLSNTNAMYHFYLCLSYAKLGDTTLALTSCENALRLRPDMVEASNLLKSLNN